MMSIAKKVLCVACCVAGVFGLTIVVDRTLGIYLNKIGYFHALTPGITELHITDEYSVVATISSQGLRNPEVLTPKPKDTFRVLVVGDSFTFGEGVGDQETYEYRLNSMEATRSGKFEFINAGKPGASPTEDRQICLAYRDRFDIDAIIMGLYADDLSQSAYRAVSLEFNPLYSFVVNTWPILTRLKTRNIGYSRWSDAHPGDTVSTTDENKRQVGALLEKNPTVLLSIPEKFRASFLKGTINPAIVTNATRLPQQFTYLLDPSSFSFVLSALKTRLTLLRERCSGNLPVYVVYIPSADQVSSKYHAFRRELGFLMDDRLTAIDIDTTLRQSVESVGFKYYSALADFRSDGCDGCYFPYDGHLTPAGQARLATYIAANVLPYVHKKQ
jgi:hypothetical protein